MIFIPDSVEAAALTAGVFAICTGELAMLLILHRLKIKKGED